MSSSSGAAASIGSTYSSPFAVENGDQLVDVMSGGINNRVKCLFTEVVTSARDLNSALIRLSAITKNLPVTRASFRFLVGHEVQESALQQMCIDWRSGSSLQLEAIVPVEGHPTVRAIVYFGAVDNSRRPDDQATEGENFLWQRACTMQRLPCDTAGTERLADPSEDDIDRLVALYRSCFDAYLVEFTPETVGAMVRGSVTYVIRDEQGVIQSIALAEQVFIQPTRDADDCGPAIPLYEVTEVATDEWHRGRGYAHRLYCAVVKAVLAIPAEVTPVIITEIRAAWFPLHALMVKVGFARCGYMPAHCAIKSGHAESVVQSGIYGDLLVCAFQV